MQTAWVHTKRILKKYELRAKKSLGQNFLVDDAVVAEIVAGSGLQPGEAVLEIGPGTGALTRALLDRAGTVLAVELDDVLFEVLREEFAAHPQVTFIHADALALNMAELAAGREHKFRLIANLPYYITSPLLRHFLAQRRFFSSMTVMVQQEVARRIVAPPGTKDYGVLSVAVQTFSEARMLLTVPPTAFVPAPKVSSAVVRLDVLEQGRVATEFEPDFFRFVKAAFGQRRKTLLNSVSQGLNLDKGRIAGALQELGIPAQVRAESLSIDDLARLAKALLLCRTDGLNRVDPYAGPSTGS